MLSFRFSAIDDETFDLHCIRSVDYPDQQHLERVLAKINTLPPLVTPAEIERLRFQLAAVQRNEAFLLHAGEVWKQNISAKIVWGGRLPVVRIGRIAGQYAKPRSSRTETFDDREVLSFRGDNINGLDSNDRTPDPERLLSAYFHSAATLNYVRGLLTSGFASLHHPRDWSLSHVRSPALRREFEKITQGLSDALDFSHTIGANSGRESVPFDWGGGRGVLGEVDFYTSHEVLMLDWEQAMMTREVDIAGSGPSPKEMGFYNTSAHFLWVGDRTRQLDGAHVEYFRVVNPNEESGRVTLITRYGAGKVHRDHLAGNIEAVKRSRHPVVWVCDPMHGNTLTSSSGFKTRNFGTIINELTSCISIHAACGSRLGGVSLEFTGELHDEGFSVYLIVLLILNLDEQSLDIAFLISNYFKEDILGDKEENGIYAALGGRKTVS
ncbi:hypothetical protein EV702DRAFT_1189002 [Suillus placidus]|uniref:Phospho-2-dehydro-3-deoxyheptonate aldolase n=1 Tax=Suillus placidus TaxID=48579 RepID=A0A9P6ZKF2_9AGAM|nr:hypothetical protein EV702DRAFT_1189002 [Suillus placidus]